ncbi:D-alanyl-D-alanine carboxypeptidase [Roseiarcaceae bacterium H3SJ34-1]|uniref:serine hydrolase n=1 Tax=Terripilifer ovatus TaxID=3032367 RepID=UPI003AB9724C|nr:D-alanyl-D-alanine carboxypeptidase [Roseiarcaceae bacterium H3SJ34-1]
MATYSYSPPFSAMVVDANSGKVLYAVNENALRHPASLTKVMTLYMLFEQLERGRIRLDSEIPISAHAASMPPTKLGLRPGQTIAVEDAIKAVVTRSANDIAAAIAEALGGDEETFSAQMTRKARALGMTRTNFANASGLPDPDQITTAHDLTILGRAIQERFPRYYPYFSTPVFYFGRQAIRNHNRLIGGVEGVDGIKTGYTRASGFNLLTSAKRDGRRIVAVVLGGRSTAQRDRAMAQLVEDNIDSGARSRTAPMIAENNAIDREPPPARSVEVARAEPVRAEPVRAAEMLRPEAPVGRPVTLASSSAYAPEERPRPAVISSGSKAEERIANAGTRSGAPVVLDGSTSSRPVVASTSTPSTLRWVMGPRSSEAAAEARAKAAYTAPPTAPKQADTKAETKVAKFAPPAPIPTSSIQRNARDTASRETPRPAAARSGLMIQIGATDDQEKAQNLLTRARAQGKSVLGSAQPFTEKVQKGGGTLWRARFAGLSEDGAEAACKSLKRSGFACFTTRN